MLFWSVVKFTCVLHDCHLKQNFYKRRVAFLKIDNLRNVSINTKFTLWVYPTLLPALRVVNCCLIKRIRFLLLAGKKKQASGSCAHRKRRSKSTVTRKNKSKRKQLVSILFVFHMKSRKYQRKEQHCLCFVFIGTA